MKEKRTAALAAIFLGAALAAAAPAADKRQLISYAEHYLREFEQEVARERGGEKTIWRSKDAALSRVQELHEKYPNDPQVQALFERARVALKKSKGDFMEITPEMTSYLRTEETLRKDIAAAGKAAWEKLIGEKRAETIEKIFPTPDYKTVSVDDLQGRYVVLENARYPQGQFYGATGEYIAVGKPSTGYYFVDISGRAWLGPYEAVKRFRRQVDTDLEDVQNWTILGKITDITSEIPDASENKVGNYQFGWVVTPVALYVPDHCMALYDANHESSGVFIGEESVQRVKESWYSVKSVPDDVTPERLMEIFVTAIKEKNFKLYCSCIDPSADRKDIDGEQSTFFWDLHQRRFHGQYVHVTFGKARIKVLKGFDEKDTFDNYFLDEKDRADIKKASGTKLEEAVVETRAWDANGKVVGSPKPHRLRRQDGGRWFVYDIGFRF